jgi:hypothetical protein
MLEELAYHYHFTGTTPDNGVPQNSVPEPRNYDLIKSLKHEFGKLLMIGGLVVGTATYIAIVPRDINFYTDPNYKIPEKQQLHLNDVKTATGFATVSLVSLITGLILYDSSSRRRTVKTKR